MSNDNNKPCFRVEFYLLNENYQLVRYEDGLDDLARPWRSYYNQLRKKYTQIPLAKKNIAKLNPSIRILFLEPGKLNGKRMLDELARTERNIPLDNLSPLITISNFDIMSLWSYPYEDEIRSASAKMIRESTLDTRYKFLDSSIWFRFVPIAPLTDDEEYQSLVISASNFQTRFSKLIKEICEYWKNGLYITNAAVATRELQLRLLLESKLSKEVGKGGHADAVTPFKFHSESFLQKRASQEIEFFHETWNEEKNCIANECSLRLMIVDDQACKGHKLSAITEESKDCTISKKKLIMAPFYKIFKKEHFKVSVPSNDQDVIKKCLEKLRKNYFDLIFLDYLLGKRDNVETNREYGHEFLLNLLKDGKKKEAAYEYKRSFQGRFWIFSISSFPFALPDKLHQLGISHLQNLWHLSYGGDPITTPHLYNYYLFRFIKQKISAYFLHPDLLLRIIKENPVYLKKSNEKFWAEYLENTILHWRHRVDLASRHAQDDDSSPFTESIAWFCKKNVPLNKTLDLILKITSLMKDGYIGGSAFFTCEMEFEAPLLRQYKPVGDYLFKQIKAFQDKYIKDQSSRIQDAKIKGLRNLNFEYLKIYELPLNIGDLSESLNELILSRNHMLSFPKSIFSLKKLSRLHLDHNPISTIAGDINSLPRLTDLNLENTPLGAKLTKPHAQNREEVLQLWKEAIAIQKNISIKKVLYFGLSPKDSEQLRVDREFHQIRIALKGERFELIPNFAVNYIDFQREVLKSNAEILHFSGHGNNQSLVFQESSGTDQNVEFKTIIEVFFKNSFARENLQCIVLNACKTNEQAKVLSSHGIYTIGMSGAIEDERSIAFSGGFYNAVHLIEDQNFEDAFLMGINAARNEENTLKKRKRDTTGFSYLSSRLTIHLYFDGEEIASEVFK
jgi:Leucine rich repeat